MTIQKFFTSRVKNVNGNAYIGDTGRLFYDEANGDFRLSDGVTPGGILKMPDIATGHGNIWIYNATIDGNLYVNGNTYSYNYINVNNTSTTTNVLDVTGNASFTGNTLFYGPVTDIGNLVVTGTATFTSLAPAITHQATSYTATKSDFTILANASAASITITLPATPLNGEFYNIKKIDATQNAVVVDGNGHTIDGAATASIIAQWQNLQLQYELSTTAWYII